MLQVFFVCLGVLLAGGESRPEWILFWNVENFFDYFDGGASESDRAFSARGERRLTKKRFLAKCQAISKGIYWIAGQRDPFGGEGCVGLPDVVALAEVENRFVLKRLLSETALRKAGYEMVHHDSPDRRGIDVALLYRRAVFDLFYERAVPVGRDSLRGEPFATRDILLVQLRRKDRPSAPLLSMLVNHHPSKYGGGASGTRREVALETLRAVKDSLWRSGERDIVAVGDFNDTPDNPALSLLAVSPEEARAPEPPAAGDVPPLVNLALPPARRGEGTIRYQGRWEMIDLALVLTPRPARMCPVRIPFLMVRDNVHPGEKPLRTYVGPRYTGGVSDHLPILLRIG